MVFDFVVSGENMNGMIHKSWGKVRGDALLLHVALPTTYDISIVV